MMNGATVPGGMKARERFTWATVSDIAWLMSVPGWNCSFMIEAPWMDFDSDVLDARDVEEVILVAVGQVALHLERVHAAIGLRHVDRRNAQRREDVARHALQAEPCAQQTADDGDEDGPGVAEGEAGEGHAGGMNGSG